MKKIGIIGFGNMGAAIAERIKTKYSLVVFDKFKDKTKNLSGIEVAEDLIGLVNNAEVIILAVKPQDFQVLLKEIKNSIKEKLVISIAAGITTGYIEKILGEVRAIRVMPNIGAKIGKAESTLCQGRYARAQDLNSAQEIFDCVGKTWKIEEELMDAATAISGSGPAYIFYDLKKNENINPKNVPDSKRDQYIVELTKAAETVGFESSIASELAVWVTNTSLALLFETGDSPERLKIMVTSPGGTTAAALEELRAGHTWSDAAVAAKRRAKELSKS